MAAAAKSTPRAGRQGKGAGGPGGGRRKVGQKKKVGQKVVKGAKLSAAEQSLRDTRMLAREAANWPIEAIAAEADLSIRQTKNAIRSRKQALGNVLEEDAEVIMRRLVEGFLSDIGDLEAMSLAYADWHPSAAVGAKKAAAAVRQNLQDLLQSVGKLPLDLGTFSVFLDVRALVVELNSSTEEFVKNVRKIAKTKKMPATARKQIEAEADRFGERLDQISGVENVNGNGKDVTDGA